MQNTTTQQLNFILDFPTLFAPVFLLINMNFNTLATLSLMTLLTACSSLNGSFQHRSQQLSQGIQKAYAVNPNTANRVAPLIIQSAEQHDLSPLTMAALIQQESSYRSQVKSSAGAVGLTQVMPRYWQTKCPGDLYDETINIACGSYILASYQQSAGSLKKALAYYNVGPSNYNNKWSMKRQGKKYARQVKAKEKQLKQAL